jgi:hypothetical protein
VGGQAGSAAGATQDRVRGQQGCQVAGCARAAGPIPFASLVHSPDWVRSPWPAGLDINDGDRQQELAAERACRRRLLPKSDGGRRARRQLQANRTKEGQWQGPLGVYRGRARQRPRRDRGRNQIKPAQVARGLKGSPCADLSDLKLKIGTLVARTAPPRPFQIGAALTLCPRGPFWGRMGVPELTAKDYRHDETHGVREGADLGRRQSGGAPHARYEGRYSKGFSACELGPDCGRSARGCCIGR